jgi:hypothetical protein
MRMNVRAMAMAAIAAATMMAGKIGKYGPLHTKPAASRRIYKLNRSQHWRPAKSYQQARMLSPFPDRPVR